jgi:hypothetical protein
MNAEAELTVRSIVTSREGKPALLFSIGDEVVAELSAPAAIELARFLPVLCARAQAASEALADRFKPKLPRVPATDALHYGVEIGLKEEQEKYEP